MRILAIETSCDETAVAIVENGQTILANLISSQIKNHRIYGGVVPELASRLHAEKINGLLALALLEAKINLTELDAIAVTYGPGLEGALLIGLTAAKTLAYTLKKPLLGVHHITGHIYANLLEHGPLPFPFLALVISGGHTSLILVKEHCDFQVIGATRDDAVGELLDKVAREMGLGYPGGPIIEQIALTGSDQAFKLPQAILPNSWDFSFSGLKTATILTIRSLLNQSPTLPQPDICASLQKTIAHILITKTLRAAEHLNLQHLVLAGGVAANNYIKTAFSAATAQKNIAFYAPSKHLCTDNAAMIGAAAYYQSLSTPRLKPSLCAEPNASLA